MMTPEELAAVRSLLDRPIAFQRSFVSLTGSVTAALMLSQAFYWSPRATHPDGWFFKTQAEWEEETGLTRREQETARRVLRERGLIEESLRGQPARLWYRVDTAMMLRGLSGVVMIGVQTSMSESAIPDSGEAPNQYGVNRQAITIQRPQPETTPQTTLPMVANAPVPVHTHKVMHSLTPIQDSATIKQPMFVLMGRKAASSAGKSLPPDSVEVTETTLEWARERGYAGDLRGLQGYAEACLLFRKGKGERRADWGAEFQSWILRNINREEQGDNNGGPQRTPKSTGANPGRQYGYNEAGQPTNRASAILTTAQQLAANQHARRLAGQAGNDADARSDGEWGEC